MDAVLGFLNQGWVGAMLGALGVGFGIYQIVRRTGPRLAYQYLGQSLIEGGGGLLPNEVVVHFEGNPVPRVSLLQIIIWNEGQTPVRGQDIVAEDPIGFAFGENAEILKAEISKRTRVANDSAVTVSQDRKTLLYKFAFLDRHDGVLLRVLHSGTNARPKPLGTIIGLPKGIESLGRIPLQSYRRRLRPRSSDSFERVIIETAALFLQFKRLFYVVTGVIGFILLAVAVFPNIVTQFNISVSTTDRILLGVLGFLYGPLGLFVLWADRRRFPAFLIPDELTEERDETPKNNQAA